MILGQHTQHELADLWAAYSFEKAALWKAGAAATTTWRQLDPAGYAAWSVGQSMLDARLAAFMPRLSTALSAPGNRDTTVVVDLQGDVFNDLVTLWGDQGGPAVGLNTLDLWMRQAPATVAAMAPSYAGLPQPTAPDFDLQAYQLTDQALKALASLASTGGTILVTVLAVGIVVLLLRKR